VAPFKVNHNLIFPAMSGPVRWQVMLLVRMASLKKKKVGLMKWGKILLHLDAQRCGKRRMVQKSEVVWVRETSL